MSDFDPDFDDLLQPTVQEEARPRGPLPWRLQSQFWVAFFGGAFAVTVIALLNAMRLDVDRTKRWLIVVAGLVGMGLTAVVFLLTEHASQSRIGARVVGVVLFLVLRPLQKGADDHHQVFRGGDYASLWGPGIAATIAGVGVNVGLSMALERLQ
ncbi:MAG TPA: hypothetical protein VF111_13705 [Thermoanaerobaculia bacterium]